MFLVFLIANLKTTSTTVIIENLHTMSTKVFVAFMVLGAGLACAQVTESGNCPTSMQGMTGFDAPAYLGTWYEQKRYPQAFQFNSKCVTAKYTLNADGNVDVLNSQVDPETNTPSSINGLATLADSSVGNFVVTFPGIPGESGLSVLATDSTRWSIVWSCKDDASTGTSRRSTWLLTREPNPSDSLIQQLMADAASLGIDTSLFTTTDQTGCTYQ